MVAFALAAAGCSGGGSKKAAPPVTSTTVLATSSTPAPATSTTVPTSTSSTKAPTVALERCHTSQLSALGGEDGIGLGNAFRVVVLTNTSAARCRLFGYPGVQRLDDQRRPMATTLSRGANYFRRDPGPVEVVLPPGAKASFALGWNHNPGPDDPQTGCLASAFAAITPPDETDPLVIALPIDACNQGSISTTAVVAGPDGPKPG